jgi:hypothetical protein
MVFHTDQNYAYSRSEIGINSTTTALDDGETFTGDWELNGFSDVGCSCKTDTSGILYFDFSNDGENVDTFPTSGFSVSAGIHEFHIAVKLPRQFRVRFVNDSGSNQTYLRLFVYFGTFSKPNAPLNQNLGLDSDAVLVRSVDPQDEVKLGRRTGVVGWTKFGFRSGLTATAGAETVWATTGNFTPMTAASTFTVTYNNSTDGASTTGATELTFWYIDADGLPAIATHTLGNDGSDVTSFTGLGINRIAVSATGTANHNTSDISVTDTSIATTQAVVPALGSVTQQAIFHVGSNHQAIAKFLYVHINKPSGGNASVQVKALAFNRNVLTTYEVFRTTLDTSVEVTQILNEPIGFNLSSTDVLYFTADTDTNNAEVVLRFSLNEYQNT